MPSGKTKLAFALCAGLLCSSAVQAQQPAPYPSVHGKYYKFEKIADGVYYATAEYNGTAFPTGSNPFFGANLVVIVNDNDVVLVDSGTTPKSSPRIMCVSNC
jgi:hypothetical protein